MPSPVETSMFAKVNEYIPRSESDVSISGKFLLLLLTTQGLLLGLVALLVHNSGWDDGAITLAFAKTFAHTGRIALTPVSDQVEGFSSIAWFFANTIPQLCGVGFRGSIVTSQMLAIFTLLGTTLMITAISRNIGLSRPATLFALVTFILFGPCFAEAVNGMEMGLLAASGAFITYCYTKPERDYYRWTLITTITVFVMARFEASFYMVFLTLPLLIERRYREFLMSGVTAIVVFGVFAILRWHLFGEIMPNTIYAKMHPPYIPHRIISTVWQHLTGLLEFPDLFAVPAGLTALMVYLGQVRISDVRHRLEPQHAYLIFPIIGVLSFSIITGKNWGYDGRMQFIAVPDALILVGVIFDRIDATNVPARFRHKLLSLSAIGTVLLSVVLSFPFDVVKRGIDHDSFGVTPQTFRTTGKIVDAVRQDLKLPTITFMTEDIGGVGLCCSRIRIVDLAMLSNQTLARQGYAALPTVLSQEAPALIEVHQYWASGSGLYNIPEFKNDYYPAFIDKTRFFIRRNIMGHLIAQHEGCIVPLGQKEIISAVSFDHRYFRYSTPLDNMTFLKRGKVYALTTGSNTASCSFDSQTYQTG